MVVVVIDNTEAVGEDPHLHGSVGAAGEDVVGRSHLDLHDARAEVPEQRLASVFIWEGVEGTLRGQAPNLQKRTVYEQCSIIKNSLVIFCVCLIVNKCCEKNKTNNELILNLKSDIAHSLITV